MFNKEFSFFKKEIFLIIVLKYATGFPRARQIQEGTSQLSSNWDCRWQ